MAPERGREPQWITGDSRKEIEKLGKPHQNVLVFCKGDPAKAVEALGPITIELPEEQE